MGGKDGIEGKFKLIVVEKITKTKKIARRER